MCPVRDSDTRPAGLLVKGPFAATYFVLLIFGAGIAVALYWGIAVAQGLNPLPRSFNAQQGAARLDALRTALTVVGGAAAVAGLYLAYRRQRNDEANSARELDKVFTERFVVLAEMLDSESSGTRLLGLNALVRLADDSDRDRGTCLRQLCSYLRRRVQSTDGTNLQDGGDGLWLADRSLWLDPEEWDVRRAAVEFLAQRLNTASPIRWTDTVDLRSAVLVEPNFENCTFGDSVDLRGAILIDAKFKGCTFKGGLDLRDSVIIGETSLAWAKFYGGIDWRGATINAELDVTDAYFRDGHKFDGATFNRQLILEWSLAARISLESAVINAGLTIEPTITSESSTIGSTTRKIDLRNARIGGAVVLPKQAIDIRGADLSQAGPLKLLDVKAYYSRLDVRGLVEDETTVWPTTGSPESSR